MGEYGGRVGQAVVRLSHNPRDAETAIADLRGRRFVVGGEIAQGARLNEPLIKDISGGDSLLGRQLYGNAFQFQPTAKLWLYGNHKPEILGIDHGFWRRVLFVPFTVQFDGDNRDPNLFDKLREELSGIFMWMFMGYVHWSREGLKPPPIVLEQVRAYRSEQDLLRQFLEDNTVERAGAFVSNEFLYSRYESCMRNESSFRILSKLAFLRALRERGWEVARKNQARGFMGRELV